MKKLLLLIVLVAGMATARAQVFSVPKYLCFSTSPGDSSNALIPTFLGGTYDTFNFSIFAPPGFQYSLDSVHWMSSSASGYEYCGGGFYGAGGFYVGLALFYVRFVPTSSAPYYDSLIVIFTNSMSTADTVKIGLIGNGYCPVTPSSIADSFGEEITQTCGGIQIADGLVNFTSGKSIKTFFGDGSAPVTNTFTSGSVILSHNYNFSGTYTIKQILFEGSSTIDSQIFSLDFMGCNTVPIGLYFDANFNCIRDASETIFDRPTLVSVDSDGISIDTISITSASYYNTNGAAGDVYTFHFLTSGGLTSECPSAGIIRDTITTSWAPMKYFGLICGTATTQDLSVNIGYHICGSHREEMIDYIQNLSGCYSFTSANDLLFQHPSNFGEVYGWNINTEHILTSSTSGYTTSFDLSTETYTDYLPIAIFCQADMTVPPYLTYGDTIQSPTTILPIIGDLNPANNTEMIIDTITASIDPNQMWVTPPYCIPFTTGATQLQYTIDFMNTGNDTAFNIFVLDTLPANVDPMSMRMVLSSAQMNLSKIKDIAGQTIIKFDFPNINLLDSSHHGLCTGTLIFTVNTRPGLPDSSVLTNRAGIYFDYNPVVMTNSVVNKVGCSIAETKVVSAPQVAIFPNPAHSQINIEADSRVYTSVAIKNILGQTVMSHALYGGETSLNIAMLPEGIYFVTFNGTDGELVKKLIKAE